MCCHISHIKLTVIKNFNNCQVGQNTGNTESKSVQPNVNTAGNQSDVKVSGTVQTPEEDLKEQSPDGRAKIIYYRDDSLIYFLKETSLRH